MKGRDCGYKEEKDGNYDGKGLFGVVKGKEEGEGWGGMWLEEEWCDVRTFLENVDYVFGGVKLDNILF